MTAHERQLLILFKALAEALKHVPDRKLTVEINDFDLRRMVMSDESQLQVLKTVSPDGYTTIYRFMRQEDYEKWCREGDRPRSRKMYLE